MNSSQETVQYGIVLTHVVYVELAMKNFFIISSPQLRSNEGDYI